jgi:polysaccharide export outer membrane protein
MVAPGLTGWAQVRYQYANNLHEEIEKLTYDLYYIKHQSPWLDTQILFETARVLVQGRGTAAPRDSVTLRRTITMKDHRTLIRRSPACVLLVLTVAAGAHAQQRPAPLAGQPRPAPAPAPATASTPARPAPARPASVPTQTPEYVIGPEDVLDIAVWDNVQLSRTVPVRPDGRISLPLLDDVQAAGLTPMELRANLEGSLKRYIPEPNVSVIVRDVQSQKVTVMGEVRQPGRYELRSRATVLDALALAGGFTEYAARGRILVLRRNGESTRQVTFAYDRIASGSIGQPNFDLEPGDIVLVP